MLGFSSKPPLTNEQKLDAVYAMLKRAERARRFFLFFRLAIVLFVVFSVASFIANPNASTTAERFFEEYITPRIVDVASRMASKMQADMLQQMSGQESDGTSPKGASNTQSSASPAATMIAQRFAHMHRSEVEDMLDSGEIPEGTLERLGTNRQAFLEMFPE